MQRRQSTEDKIVSHPYFHLDGLDQAGPLQLLHLVGHGGTEELRAPVARDDLEDLIDLLLRVQVEQRIRVGRVRQDLEECEAGVIRV